MASRAEAQSSQTKQQSSVCSRRKVLVYRLSPLLMGLPAARLFNYKAATGAEDEAHGAPGGALCDVVLGSVGSQSSTGSMLLLNTALGLCFPLLRLEQLHVPVSTGSLPTTLQDHQTQRGTPRVQAGCQGVPGRQGSVCCEPSSRPG